jgi:ADP-ribose pyrophosphatase YjhB (NUDIX family)
MKIKEYAFEKNSVVDRESLISEKMPLKEYQKAHASLVILCHDVFIEYQNALMLVVRENDPIKGELCPLGGRQERGLSITDSLQKKVHAECGLKLEDNLKYLGCARTCFATDPFGHDKGTDTMNLVYYAKATGEINLDTLHSHPTLVQKKTYTKEFREQLHPYVADFMDKAIKHLEDKIHLG